MRKRACWLFAGVSNFCLWVTIFRPSYANYLYFVTVDWYRTNGTLPTLKEFLEVYILPEKDHPDYEKKATFLTRYCNEWLVKCAGNEHYGRTVRPYKMAVSSKKIKGFIKSVAIVAMESEAFGRLMFENCREKWMHMIPAKLKDDKWKIPAFDKEKVETHKYHITKFSDKNAGQIKGVG